MTARARITGKGLTFKINSVDYNVDATSVVLQNEEDTATSDTLTFADAATSTAAVKWFFEVTAIVSTDTDSFWTYLWTNSGQTGVSFVFAPHANTTATAAKPHFTGTVTLPEKPSIGGEANSTWTFTVRIDLEAAPTKVVA